MIIKELLHTNIDIQTASRIHDFLKNIVQKQSP